MDFLLENVGYIPKDLQPGVLYVSKKYQTAAHLCACGCGLKVRTPLGATEWKVTRTKWGPTLHPSVGNWQKPCRSHYYIRRGEVIWCDAWDDEQIVKGRVGELRRRELFFKERKSTRRPQIKDGIIRLFSFFFGPK